MKEFNMTLRKNALMLVVLSFILAACGLPFGSDEPTLQPTLPLPPAPTATPAPRNLTVCLGEEPNTLYPYGGPNAAARSVLAAVYDGPIDTVGYEYQPVILTQLPSFANGDAQIAKLAVAPGSEVVNADGALVLLEAGTRVRPAGCRGDDCILAYDGSSPLEMDQMVVTFRLRSDVTWSDGTPLSADDSVYAYSLALDPATPGSTFLIDRTQTYEAADAKTVQWWGKPGFIDPAYFTNFWSPAPKHLWNEFSPTELLQTDISSRTPAGWGPYVVQDWLPADHITLTRNPQYFRSADGFPKFDTLTFRFIADPNSAISELAAGRCDVLDPTVRLDGQAGLLREMNESGEAQAFFAPGMTIEWLGLGIKPASYDDGYNTLIAKDRPDLFADARTRQGIAFCLDRQKVVDTVLFGLTSVPNTFLPPEHPLYNNATTPYPFDPATGIQLLEQAGWKDTDGNPATPRQASGVTNVSAGTPLTLNYYTTTATQRRQVTEILTASLAQCGIGLNVQHFSQNDLYAPGPDGVLFGRRFDLIEYAMGVIGFEPPCTWFTAAEIPNASNRWIGTNVTGYQSGAFDAACHAARLALPDETAYAESYRQTQAIFSADLPAIPLYFRLRTAAARPDFCHFDLDPSAAPLWNIEAFDYGPSCQN
jgi:peptide/nickel transport system substrate-binding protein